MPTLPTECLYFNSVDPSAAQRLQSGSDPIPILNGLDWTEGTGLARSLQDSVQNSRVFGGCSTESVSNIIIKRKAV